MPQKDVTDDFWGLSQMMGWLIFLANHFLAIFTPVFKGRLALEYFWVLVGLFACHVINDLILHFNDTNSMGVLCFSSLLSLVTWSKCRLLFYPTLSPTVLNSTSAMNIQWLRPFAFIIPMHLTFCLKVRICCARLGLSSSFHVISVSGQAKFSQLLRFHVSINTF